MWRHYAVKHESAYLIKNSKPSKFYIHFLRFQDIATELGSLTISAARTEVVDFMLPIYETYFTAILKTKPKSRFLIIQPLQYRVWLSYLVMAVSVAVVLHVVETIFHGTQNRSSCDNPRFLWSAMWMNCRIVAYQGMSNLRLKVVIKFLVNRTLAIL